MLVLNGLEAGYDGVRAIGPIDLVVETGTVTALLGANGAGKTTTLDAIAGLVQSMNGDIQLDGDSLDSLNAPKRARRGVAYALEGHRVFAEMSVLENLQLAADGQKRAKEADWDECYRLFPVLKERPMQLAGSLSGGERQMLALGRALLGDPRILLLDEPSLGLAPRVVETVYEAIGQLAGTGRTILLSEQNVGYALEVADSVAVLDRGSLVLSGPTQDLKDSDAIRSAYLG